MNRPEPRPLPKPLRVLCLFVAALLVCSLGVIVANHQPSTAGDDHGSATDAKQESTGKRKTDSGPRRYAGLEAAGIPVSFVVSASGTSPAEPASQPRQCCTM